MIDDYTLVGRCMGMDGVREFADYRREIRWSH